MNDIEKYFKENTALSIHKWQHYFDVYDRHFSRFRDTDVHIVEFGVSEGGHRMQQQINTFEELFPSVESNGVYFCEDMHTSYWKGWGGGGYKKKGTLIEYT